MPKINDNFAIVLETDATRTYPTGRYCRLLDNEEHEQYSPARVIRPLLRGETLNQAYIRLTRYENNVLVLKE